MESSNKKPITERVDKENKRIFSFLIKVLLLFLSGGIKWRVQCLPLIV